MTHEEAGPKIAEILTALGLSANFETGYHTTAATGTAPGRVGVHIAFYGSGRFEVRSEFPKARDGRTQDYTSNNFKASMDASRPTARLVNEVRRRVLDPATAHLPAVLERIDEHHAFLDRIDEARTFFDGIGLELRGSDSNGLHEVYRFKPGIDYRFGMSVRLSSYPSKENPTASVEFSGIGPTHVKYLLEVFRNF